MTHNPPLYGDGLPDCPLCKGRGVIPVDLEIGGVRFPGGKTQNCECVFKRDLIFNVKRIWPPLLGVPSVEDSPLAAFTTKNTWVTSSNLDFKQHLRFVAFRQGPLWDARVVSDSALVTAWLSTTRKDVVDPDVLRARQADPSQEFLSLVDLAAPFALLIILLGVKAAKNRETPNVLMEVLAEREILDKPTWIVDSPGKPFAPGHICFSEGLAETFSTFKRVVLSTDTPVQTGLQPFSLAPPTSGSNPYTQVKGGMQKPVPRAAPKPPRPPKEKALPDEDDLSVEALLAQATALGPPDPVDIEDIPTEDLGTDYKPAFLRKKP